MSPENFKCKACGDTGLLHWTHEMKVVNVECGCDIDLGEEYPVSMEFTAICPYCLLEEDKSDE